MSKVGVIVQTSECDYVVTRHALGKKITFTQQTTCPSASGSNQDSGQAEKVLINANVTFGQHHNHNMSYIACSKGLLKLFIFNE